MRQVIHENLYVENGEHIKEVENVRIAVCIITYRRPDGLRRLLEGLNELTFSRSKAPSVEIVVIDNDSTGSALTVCNEVASNLKWPIKYRIEPQRGISQARNTAIECAASNVDFIGFIDDDEVPKPHWLEALLDVQRAYAADVVSGPVLPYFTEIAPDWVIKGKFFDQVFANPRYVTGHPIKLTATGNVLIRADVIREMGITFDERLGLTGGEDIHFFKRIHEANYKMVYAGDALVYEWIPPSRTDVSWILRRAYRLGNALSLSEAHLDPTTAMQLVRISKGAGRIIQGLLLLPVSIPLSLVLGQHVVINPLLHICRGIGMLAGLAGIRFEPYR